MKILENNYDKNTKKYIDTEVAVKVVCNFCTSKLEVTIDDTHIGWLGDRHIKCPCCGEEVCVEEFKGVHIGIDNLEFPRHFLRTKVGLRRVKEVFSDEIVKYIKDTIESFRLHKNDYIRSISVGDMYLIVRRNCEEEEYNVMVTKDFYETDIPFDWLDY
jgi:superfamily II helicase